jgi:hypothetical protein
MPKAIFSVPMPKLRLYLGILTKESRIDENRLHLMSPMLLGGITDGIRTSHGRRAQRTN